MFKHKALAGLAVVVVAGAIGIGAMPRTASANGGGGCGMFCMLPPVPTPARSPKAPHIQASLARDGSGVLQVTGSNFDPDAPVDIEVTDSDTHKGYILALYHVTHADHSGNLNWTGRQGA